MIKGHLIKVTGREEELTGRSRHNRVGYDVWIRSRRDGLEICRVVDRHGLGRAPIMKLALSPEMLVNCIGKGRYHRLGEKFVEGVKVHQVGEGTVDLVGGIDAARDGPDRHQLQSMKFSYAEDDNGFWMLIDVVFGDGLPGLGCNGWAVHGDVTGHRVWINCHSLWSELYDLHEWALLGAGSDIPGEALRKALGIEVSRPNSNQSS